MIPSRDKIVISASNPKEGRLMARHLKKGGFRTLQAKDWHACFKSLKKEPSLLLLDLSLNNADKILKHAKKNGGNGKENGLPVLAFDRQKNTLREIRAFRLGVDEYVGRPLIKEELISAILPWLGQRDQIKKYEKGLEEEKKKRKKLEEELNRVSEFAEKISAHMPLSILIVDPEKRLTYMNQHFARVTGSSPDFLLGRFITDIFPEMLYEPIALVQKIDSVLQGGPPTPRLTMQYRGNNYVYRVLPIAFREKRGGVHSGKYAMILIESVAELHALGEKVSLSEETYRALFEESPDGILLTRPKGGRILETNRQAERMLGERGPRLKKKSVLGFYPPKAKGELKKLLGQSISSRGAMVLPDLTLNFKKGKKIILAGSARPIYHRGQEALLCIFRDVTERKLLEDQVRQSEKMSILGQFSAGTAHEINNPLAIISSNAQYLHSKLQDGKGGKNVMGEVIDTLNTIDREARFCGGIIKNLLAYTHTKEVVKQPIDLGEVFKECLQIVEKQLKLSNIEVEIKREDQLPKISGDANLLKQVFMNLIWNAQGAMPKGGELQIRMHTIKPEKGPENVLEVTVKDTGVGITKEHRQKLFTPFFTTKEVGKGTGLGLWVVRSILEEHKATIEVKSSAGHGTRFNIRFPVARTS